VNSKSYQDLLVILPTLNEQYSIATTIKSIQDAAPGCKILVVDNGSTDETLSECSKHDVQIAHEPNKGKGYAIRCGFSLITKEYCAVFMVDADDTYGVSEIEKAFHMVTDKGYDMVVGNRVAGTTNHGRAPEYKRGHRLGNATFSLVGNLIHSVGIRDSLSGWRMMSAAFVRSFPGGASGFEIEAELNGHADLLKCAISNVDVAYRGRADGSNSKLRTYSDGLKIFRRNIQIFKNDQPFKAFSILWVPILLISIYFTQRAVSGYLKSGLVEQLPSFIAGVSGLSIAGLLWVTGMNLERSKQIRSILARYEYNRSKGFNE
jgi:glycosyltransferase involved in cell wall biosynthesis